MPKTKQQLAITIGPPRKYVVPKTAFTRENPGPHAFKPGHSGNPSGKAKNPLLPLSRALKVRLGQRAPDRLCLELGLPVGATWSELIAARLAGQAAEGDVASARLLCELTEPKSSLVDAWANADGTPYAPPRPVIRFIEGKLPGGE